MPAQPVRGTAADVPFLAVAPDSEDPAAPVVVAWHLMDPPRTEAAFAAALPFAGLDAWRIYLGLPMCGERLPAGGADELMRLGYQDAVLNLQGPIATQGAAEFPPALADLRSQLGIQRGPLALVGGSMGSAVAALTLTETAPAAGETVTAAVLVSPIVQLRDAVEATGRRFGVTYPWAPASLAVSARLDFVARADEIAQAGQPAVRLVVGSDDDPPTGSPPAGCDSTSAAPRGSPARGRFSGTRLLVAGRDLAALVGRDASNHGQGVLLLHLDRDAALHVPYRE
jgi:hypothetical protein